MRKIRQQPTLLVFTRGVESETRRRRLLPARLAAVERTLFRRCLASALEAGRESGCRITVSSPSPVTDVSGVGQVRQTGGDFGSRLRTALAAARRESTGPVIVVGTDVPGLTGDHLRAALGRLDASPASVVVGPSEDGGFYLLASNRPLGGLLAAVSWNRRDTLRSLRAVLSRAGIEVSLLEPLVDLDRPQDLASWASRGASAGAWRALVRLVRQALGRLTRPVAPSTIGRPCRPTVRIRTGRAPPLPA